LHKPTPLLAPFSLLYFLTASAHMTMTLLNNRQSPPHHPTQRRSLAVLCAIPMLLAASVFLAPLTAQAQSTSSSNSKVLIKTSLGDMEAELYADKAPKTVANFVQYVNDKHYDGLIFHRVIPGFMVQGGGYDVQYKEKKTRAPVAHEGRQALAAGLKNTVGTLAMARTNDPQSATAQFFINVVDNAFLDPSFQSFGYTVFGKVTSGMDVLQKIRTTPTGSGGPFSSDVPRTPVLIQSITLLK
jgi:peptidyl-prolyl cis-trans isomerase A (cyclophilin A)